MSLFADLPEACRANVPLAPLTWFGIGGPAEWLIEPRTEDELATVVHRCRESGLQVRFLGLGANLLVGDDGVRGAVIRLSQPAFMTWQRDGDRIEAGGGAHLTRLVKAAVAEGLSGLEALAGIPGTVGGGIRMNCGGKFGEIGSAVERVRVILPDGRAVERRASELGFAYRRSNLGGAIVVSATFRLSPMEPQRLHDRYMEIWEFKSRTQPPLEDCSAGCIFKNPAQGPSAGKLIDDLGLKGLSVGGAAVSDRHANFIVARPGARAADIVRLIEQIEQRVFDATGVRLVREVEVW
mgnify:CR=1 FL=1